MRPEDICVVVTYDDYYEDMAAVTVEKNIRHYCLRHGYHIFVDKRTIEGRHACWNKIAACIDVLPKYKWIFFLDLDCLIMNHTIRLETLIDDRYSFILPRHFIPAVDTPIHIDWKTDNVISAQFFVQNTEMGMQILQDIWEAKESGDKMNTFDYDGRQVKHTIMKPQFSPHVKIVEERLLNTFWWTASPFVAMYNTEVNKNNWQPGDFIVHVTGYKKEWRIEILEHLNHFSGGLIIGFTREKDKVLFSSLTDMHDIKLQVVCPELSSVTNYTFPALSKRLKYILYAEGLDDKPLIVNAFDGVKLISTKYLPC